MFRAEPPWGDSLKVIAVVFVRLTNSPAARAISQLFLCLRGAPPVHPQGTNTQRLRQPDGASASVARELDMVRAEFGVWGGCLPGACGSGPGSEVDLMRSGFGARGGYSLRGHGSGPGSEICVVRSEIGARGEHSLRGFRSGRFCWGFCLVCLSPALGAAARLSTALRLSAGRRRHFVCLGSRAGASASRLSLPCHGGGSLRVPPSLRGSTSKALALCQCVNARLLDSRQDNDANNGLLFWVQFSLLDRRGAHQEQPGEGRRAPIVSDERDLSLHSLFKLNFGGQTEFARNPVWCVNSRRVQ